MSGIKFFMESLKNLKTVGTVTRTSSYVSKVITDLLDFKNIRVLVELGAGDGAITKHLLNKMHPDAKLFSFEVNHEFCLKLNALNDMRLFVVKDSAEKLEHYLHLHGIDQVDAIVSALPFAIIPDKITNQILNSSKKCLKPGARYIQIHYSLSRKKLYESIFGTMKKKFIAFNLPPLFVFYTESENN